MVVLIVNKEASLFELISKFFKKQIVKKERIKEALYHGWTNRKNKSHSR